MNKVTVENGIVKIAVTDNFRYEVALADIPKKRKWGTQSWLLHLREKRWFTKDVEDQFFAICRTHGVEPTQAWEA